MSTQTETKPLTLNLTPRQAQEVYFGLTHIKIDGGELGHSMFTVRATIVVYLQSLGAKYDGNGWLRLPKGVK